MLLRVAFCQVPELNQSASPQPICGAVSKFLFGRRATLETAVCPSEFADQDRLAFKGFLVSPRISEISIDFPAPVPRKTIVILVQWGNLRGNSCLEISRFCPLTMGQREGFIRR